VSDLHYLSASDALRLFRTHELSPVELLTAVIARAGASWPSPTRSPKPTT
jgi:aspartyl-tRNA(Asn)/glutamyl-tRNA(Gln) amidotransferase subunit A